MQQNLIKRTAVYSLIFCVAAIGIIFFLSAGKVITITEVAQDEVQENSALKENKVQEGSGQSLTFLLGEADTDYLKIPLPKGCKADDIIIENHYMDKELWILVPEAEDDFYLENAIAGNQKMVKQGTFESVREGCRLKFLLTGIYECRTILENENLYISFQTPREIYDKIIVIDPACGGTDMGYIADGISEKEVTLEIARKLKEKLDDSDIKVYYTRMDDENPSEENRVSLANDAQADMYIRIQVNWDEDASVYGTETIYNGDYFIPGFGSVELAHWLEREVVTSIKGKALGLVEAGEDAYTVREATVPVAAINVGYISNKQEAILLQREEYTDKVATGIYNAILGIYEEGNIGQ